MIALFIFSFNDLNDARLKKKSGIYSITCRPTKKMYIGQAGNLYSRLYGHKQQLFKNKHCNQYLQNAYIKYGADNFELSVLEYVDKQHLNSAEKNYIDVFDSTNMKNGYNLKYFDDNGIPKYSERLKEDYKDTRKSNRKLTKNDATVIRELYREGYSIREIYRIYKLRYNHIGAIIHNEVWSDESYIEQPPACLSLDKRNILDKLLYLGHGVSKLYEDTGIHRNKIIRYFKEKSIPIGKATSEVLNTETGIYYDNISDAALSTGYLKSGTLRKWLKEAPHLNTSPFVLLLDSVRKTPNTKILILNTETGIYYDTYHQAAETYNISSSTIRRWLVEDPLKNKTSLILV